MSKEPYKPIWGSTFQVMTQVKILSKREQARQKGGKHHLHYEDNTEQTYLSLLGSSNGCTAGERRKI